MRVERLAAGERQRDRVDREVARPEVLLDPLAAQRGHVDVPVAARRLRPPRVEVLRERERGAARGPGDLPRRALLAARHGEIDVDHRAAEQRVAQRPADDSHVLAVPEGLARGSHRRRPGEPVERLAHGHDETSASRRSEAPEAATGSGAPRRRSTSIRNGTSRPAQVQPIKAGSRWRRSPASIGRARNTHFASSTSAAARRRRSVARAGPRLLLLLLLDLPVVAGGRGIDVSGRVLGADLEAVLALLYLYCLG